MLLLLLQGYRGEPLFFLPLLSVPYIFAQNVSLKFQPFAACVLMLLFRLFFFYFFFFYLPTALQVMQCNSHAKMSCICEGKEAVCNSSRIQMALETILLFFDFCLCCRKPDFNESFEGEDISNKVICNVRCLYRCVILMCTELVDAVTCWCNEVRITVVIIFFSLQCSVFCQQVFFSFSYVCTVFFSHFLACFLLPNKLSIFLESNAFPMLSQAGFTLESRLAALLGETFLSPVTSTLSACGTCRKKQKTKKKQPFQGFFFLLVHPTP